MVRALIRALIATGLFAVLVGAAIGWWWYSANANSGTLPNGIAYTKHTMETTRPLTVDEARKHWKGFGFPDSATNVYIGAYHEWQAVVEVVRFEAPVQDCLATAQEIFGKDVAENLAKPIPNSSSHLPRTNGVFVIPADRTDRQLAPLKAPWFNPSAIRVGTAMLGNGEYTPEIWVDTELGIFYFHRSQ